MSDINERIDRFKFMADADPNNELGHFSLGRAYMDAERYADAVTALQKALTINPNLSKAYQMVGQSLLKQDKPGEAVAALTQGLTIADARGEMLPRNEMVELLKSLGAAIPELKASTGPTQTVAVGAGEVFCKRCNQIRPKLEKPPFRNAFGQLIQDNACAACWGEAIGVGTKVINELRLDLSDPRAHKIWDQNIREFLSL